MIILKFTMNSNEIQEGDYITFPSINQTRKVLTSQVRILQVAIEENIARKSTTDEIIDYLYNEYINREMSTYFWTEFKFVPEFKDTELAYNADTDELFINGHCCYMNGTWATTYQNIMNNKNYLITTEKGGDDFIVLIVKEYVHFAFSILDYNTVEFDPTDIVKITELSLDATDILLELLDA